MTSGLKRDPTVILRIDGEDLEEFINGPTFEPEMASIFSQMELSSSITLHDSILSALHKLGVEHGLPPPSDSWVMSNILEPALEAHNPVTETREPISQEAFLAEFKRVAEKVREHLKEQPVIVAHTENLFDGSAIKRLLANKFELEKALKNALETLPRDSQGKISMDNLPTALASLSSPAGLPPHGGQSNMQRIEDEDEGGWEGCKGGRVQEASRRNTRKHSG
ncbi:hypothetical protein V2J09_003157 [Rumex salicifolius]